MDTINFTRIALPVIITAFFAAALVWPAVRQRRRIGTWGVAVHRKADPYQHVLGVAMGLFLIGIVAWTVLYLVAGPEWLSIWPAPALLAWTGVLLAVVGLSITVIAQAHMGTAWRIGIDDRPTPLVTGGLYRLVRNPIYTGMLLMVSGIVLLTPSPWTVMALLVYVLLISLQTRAEERHLLALHGDGHRAYVARVGRLVPYLGRNTSST